ncbi:MAG: pyridoxamine 5'-phosphate oxidase family protein [Anaerolineaceae bacterium]|nr:pyridoxamine 5'-phosphate oxidase family protein [Anaerolineaceae bacterium]
MLPFSDLLDLPSMTICTSTPQGVPHAASVYFVADDRLSLYFLSAASSQHVQDVALNPLAAVTIEPLVDRWQEIRGLQMRGTIAEIPNGFQSVAGWARYLAKFPYVKNFEIEVLKNRFYAFKPGWVRLVDNRLRFGYKQEWSGDELLRLCTSG